MYQKKKKINLKEGPSDFEQDIRDFKEKKTKIKIKIFEDSKNSKTALNKKKKKKKNTKK